MRILIIRHGDPDYEHDSLTEKGWREAALLADKLEKETLRNRTGCRNLMPGLYVRTRLTELILLGTGCRKTGRLSRNFMIPNAGRNPLSCRMPR